MTDAVNDNSDSGNDGHNHRDDGNKEGEAILARANDSVRAAMQRQAEAITRKKAKKAEREAEWRLKYG